MAMTIHVDVVSIEEWIFSGPAIREKDMEESKLLDVKRRAEETMKNRVTAMEYAKLEVELAKALAHLQGVQKLRHSRKGL